MRIYLACSQLNTKAEIKTPTTTATARSVATVTAETVIRIKASLNGTFPIILKLDHSNVLITTINITPISAANGICSISGDAININNNRNSAALIPENRPRPPEFTLIMLCPIIAQPPMPPKKPVTVLATPCPIHS